VRDSGLPCVLLRNGWYYGKPVSAVNDRGDRRVRGRDDD
jgi:hypothetical protein